MFKTKRALQKKGTKSAKRHLRKVRRKQARFRRDCDRIDQHWEIAVNGKRETVHIPGTAERMAVDLPGFAVAVWYDGWVAGVFNSAGGWFAAGAVVNEDALIAALEKAEKEACCGRGDYSQ